MERRRANRPVWVSMGHAHRPNEQPNVEIWASRPRHAADGAMVGRLLASVCASGFTRATGIRLTPGDVRKVRFAVATIEEAT